MTIGTRLKQWRKEQNLTMRDITDATGIAQGAYSEYERDIKQIGTKTLLSLFRTFNIDINYILTGNKEQNIDLTNNEKELLQNFKYLPEREQIKFIGKLEDAASPYKHQEHQGKTSSVS